MTAPKGEPGHNAVFEEEKRPDGTTYWKVFEEVVGGDHERTELIGEIHIDEHGFESPLLFVGAHRYDGSNGLHPRAELFFSSYIESRFIYQLAEFMREIEKQIVETDTSRKLVTTALDSNLAPGGKTGPQPLKRNKGRDVQ
jgi:hypothetical protein